MNYIFVVFAASLVTCSTSTLVRNCSYSQFECGDGICIDEELKCNGAVDCPDGRDESFVTCFGNSCNSNKYRCSYGACVKLNATCDGVKDCADNSDEVLLTCQNKVSYEDCVAAATHAVGDDRPLQTCERNERKCQNGQLIMLEQQCDGIVHCGDGSDETIENCGNRTCKKLIYGLYIRCKYGACLLPINFCNGVIDCADGSDELEEICQKFSEHCILPQFPENGYYISVNISVGPGDSVRTRRASVGLNYFCNKEYTLVGTQYLSCYKGQWSADAPKCLSHTQIMCRLRKHPSVEYLCLLKNSSNQDSAKECDVLVEDGTIVQPKCRQPNYYYPGIIYKMNCINGEWDRIIVCQAQCGLLSPKGNQQILGGRNAKRGELPWHVGIYTKTTDPYMQICGGSLISNTVLISAAHCFWNDGKQQSAADFAIAVGNLYRPWSDPHDKDAQKSDVLEIKIPDRFRGAEANYQDDIALVTLKSPFEFRTYVRPVCIDFNTKLKLLQLRVGATGKVAGWGLNAEDGVSATMLQVVELPYVEVAECIESSPPEFIEYITSDKICAGFKNGTGAVCMGDSGGGLAFVAADQYRTPRYYLRGVASTAPTSDHHCNANDYTTFTDISKHEEFIKKHLEQWV